MKRPKNKSLTFRARDDLREQLGNAAEKAQQSISEEIERRLEQSFDHEAQLAELQTRNRELEQERDRTVKDCLETIRIIAGSAIDSMGMRKQANIFGDAFDQLPPEDQRKFMEAPPDIQRMIFADLAKRLRAGRLLEAEKLGRDVEVTEEQQQRRVSPKRPHSLIGQKVAELNESRQRTARLESELRDLTPKRRAPQELHNRQTEGIIKKREDAK
jgi:hypothetical protein